MLKTSLQIAVDNVLQKFNKVTSEHDGSTYEIAVYKEDVQIKDMTGRTGTALAGILVLQHIKDGKVTPIHQITRIIEPKDKYKNVYIQELMNSFLYDCLGVYCLTTLKRTEQNATNIPTNEVPVEETKKPKPVKRRKKLEV